MALLSMGYYGLHAAVSWLALVLLARSSKLEALVLAASGYAVQHLASSALQLLVLWLASGEADGVPSASRAGLAYWFLCGIVYALAYLGIWWWLGRSFVVDGRKIHASVGRTLLCAGLLVVCIALNLVYAESVGQGLAARACRTYDLLCTGTCLALLVTLSRTDRLSSDLTTVREQQEAQERQHALEADGLRRVNRIFHDALHEQAAQARTGSPNDAQALTDAVASYDALAQTGDPTLDALLTDKGLVLGQKGIQLSAMVDGTAFRFMGEADARELWADVLDCLAAAASTAPDPEFHTIAVTAERRGAAVVMEAQCFCADDLPLSGGLPATSGGANPAATVTRLTNRYDGNLHGSLVDGIYTLHVTFVPLSARMPRH